MENLNSIKIITPELIAELLELIAIVVERGYTPQQARELGRAFVTQMEQEQGAVL